MDPPRRPLDPPRRVSATKGEVLVAYGQFALQEGGGAHAIAIPAPAGAEDAVAAGGPGGVHFWSSGNDHYPSVQVEYWSGEPPRSLDDWETTRDETFSVSGMAELDLQGLFGEESDAATITLPHRGQYRIRVHVRGRREAAERGEAEFFHGLEHWLLQIWPSLVSTSSDHAAPRCSTGPAIPWPPPRPLASSAPCS